MSGLAAGSITVVAYSIGSGRGLNYDEAVTVGHFVVTPSVLDALREQVVYNNHVLFSVLEHGVYSITGDRSEAVLRILPITAGGAAVAAVLSTCWRRMGALAAIAAGVVLATNPLFVETSRQVRGYSLLVVLSVVGTILVLSPHSSDDPLWSRRSVGYVVVMAGAIATHLYAVFVLIGHVVALIAGRRASVEWRVRWYVATMLGLAAYAGVAQETLATRQRRFEPDFPLELVTAMLGGGPVTVALLSVVLALAAASYWGDATFKAVAAVYAGLILVVWLVVAPSDLYPRFFVWAVPGVAAATGAAVRGRLPLVALVLAAGVVSVTSQIASYTDDPIALRAAGDLVSRATMAGRRACSIGLTSEPLVGYTRSFMAVGTEAELDRCDMVVWVVTSYDRSLAEAARQRLPVVSTLPARSPGFVFCRTGELLCMGERERPRP